jgi:hypothetical protein
MWQQVRHLLYCLPLLAVRNNRSKTPLRCGFEDIAICSMWSGFSVDRWLFRHFQGGLSAVPLPGPPVLTVLVRASLAGKPVLARFKF